MKNAFILSGVELIKGLWRLSGLGVWGLGPGIRGWMGENGDSNL